MAEDLNLNKQTRDTQLSDIEARFDSAFEKMELQQLAVDQAIAALSGGNSIVEDPEVENSVAILKRGLQQQRSANDNFSSFCNEAQNRVRCSRAEQSIKSVHADDGIALAGVVNIPHERRELVEIRQTIDSVSAIKKGTSVAGWVNVGDATRPPRDSKTGPTELTQEIHDIKSANSGTTLAGVVEGFDFSRMYRT